MSWHEEKPDVWGLIVGYLHRKFRTCSKTRASRTCHWGRQSLFFFSDFKWFALALANHRLMGPAARCRSPPPRVSSRAPVGALKGGHHFPMWSPAVPPCTGHGVCHIRATAQSRSWSVLESAYCTGTFVLGPRLIWSRRWLSVWETRPRLSRRRNRAVSHFHSVSSRVCARIV